MGWDFNMCADRVLIAAAGKWDDFKRLFDVCEKVSAKEEQKQFVARAATGYNRA
ncbi:hypothetical protein AGMMS49545_21480 [Betaproteobacteria bacterium]|nr:hypothetical protein AGMMS49545_21480 [Betaproteobacteria bacterium]GHU47178.1 hypothetical protein AGMMS50289_21970 [Betaproteobacteria bacterium]